MAEVKNVAYLPWDEVYLQYLEECLGADFETEPMSREEWSDLSVKASEGALEDEKMRRTYPDWSTLFLDFMEDVDAELFKIEPMTLEEYSDMLRESCEMPVCPEPVYDLVMRKSA